ncbi:MAG: hypothetical protein ACE15C_17245 [Phycisphaerae bacterium]
MAARVRLTGADFEVLDRAPAGAGRLLVGPQAAKQAYPLFSTETLGADGPVLRTAGNALILAGGPPRGTPYAVYTFLEDIGGCRWWSSKASTIPRKTTLKVPPLNVVQMGSPVHCRTKVAANGG